MVPCHKKKKPKVVQAQDRGLVDVVVALDAEPPLDDEPPLDAEMPLDAEQPLDAELPDESEPDYDVIPLDTLKSLSNPKFDNCSKISMKYGSIYRHINKPSP